MTPGVFGGLFDVVLGVIAVAAAVALGCADWFATDYARGLAVGAAGCFGGVSIADGVMRLCGFRRE